MLRTLKVGLLIGGGCLALGATSFVSQVQQDKNDVLAAERAALDRWGRGDPEGFLSLYASDVTYFDPFQESRVDGVVKLRAIYAPMAGKFKIDRYEIVNPRVERSGDMAVLTYNLQNYARQPDGTERPASRWNSSSVFRRVNGRWRTIHSHWSFTKPDIRQPGSP